MAKVIDPMELHEDHERCLRCNRRLKQQDARAKGYGRVCERKTKAEMELKQEKIESAQGE